MNKKNEVAIKVAGVHKSFRLPHEKNSSVKGLFVNIFRQKRGYETQRVLKDISFEINEGDFFGIVGRNGSGKSTLLKLLAGIYYVDKGSIQINGKLTPFIELGVGFNPELTGRENVFLNGALLGFSRKEMEGMYDEIVEFAELERFMDQKLKNYSSGMQVRLAFSIAIRANSDILLLDEVLAVGDEAFQKKCFSYFSTLRKKKKTVVLVTHDMSAVQRFCTRAMLIDSGEIKKIGNVEKVTKDYQQLNRINISKPDKEQSSVKEDIQDIIVKNNKGTIKTIVSNENKKCKLFTPESKVLKVVNKIEVSENLDDVFFGFSIWKENGEPVYWYTTEKPNKTIGSLKAGNTCTVTLEIDNIFGDGKYSISVSVKSNDRSKEYIIIDNVENFEVVGHGRNGWMLHPKDKVNIIKNTQ